MRDSSEHPSKDIKCSNGNELKDKSIILCITGSVSAYRAIDLARLLIRHGAEVYPIMTESVASILLHPEMMKWATGNNVVTSLTGNLEHILFADYGKSDLILVYPCTANTIGKFANGIDDTPVTSILSVALGSNIPIMIAPAMHESMYHNPIITENINKLKYKKVIFIEPQIKEGKAKLVTAEEVLEEILVLIYSKKILSGKKILVTAGSTLEHIDPIRVITNISSGKMGCFIAEEGVKMGAQVTLILGNSSYTPKDKIQKIIKIKSTYDMYKSIIDEINHEEYDILIHSAAVTDYLPFSSFVNKVKTSEGVMNIKFSPTIKIIDEIKKVKENIFLIAFKAEYNISPSELVERAFRKLNESKSDLIIANDVNNKDGGIGSDLNEVIIVNKRKEQIHLPLQSKRTIAQKILKIACEDLHYK